MNRDSLRYLIREEIKLILEERGLTKKFDKTVFLYQQLAKQMQDEILKFKKEFPLSKDKETYKKQYIEKIKPIQLKFKQAQDEYNKALLNLPSPDEDELI